MFFFQFSSESSTRGVLVAYSNISGAVGAFLVYTLNLFLPWRTISLIGLTIPAISAIALCFVRIDSILFRTIISTKSVAFRFPKRLNGFYRKIAPDKPKIHCDGFADGHQNRQSLRNLTKCSDTVNDPNHAIRALKTMSSVCIRFQRCVKNFMN